MAGKNKAIEDFCAVAGFTATKRLMMYFGGCVVHIPSNPLSKTLVAKILGPVVIRLLADEFGDQAFRVPVWDQSSPENLEGVVYRLLKKGSTPQDISNSLKLSRGHIRLIMRPMIEIGLIERPKQSKRKPRVKMKLINTPENTPENAQQKCLQKMP
jgi:hypothetical protein